MYERFGQPFHNSDHDNIRQHRYTMHATRALKNASDSAVLRAGVFPSNKKKKNWFIIRRFVKRKINHTQLKKKKKKKKINREHNDTAATN